MSTTDADDSPPHPKMGDAVSVFTAYFGRPSEMLDEAGCLTLTFRRERYVLQAVFMENELVAVRADRTRKGRKASIYELLPPQGFYVNLPWDADPEYVFMPHRSESWAIKRMEHMPEAFRRVFGGRSAVDDEQRSR